MKVILIAVISFLIVLALFVGLILGTTEFTGFNTFGKYFIAILIIGFIVLFLLPTAFSVFLAIKDTYNSFKSGSSKITFKQWFYNLVPFRPIDVLIHQVYPNEKILNRKRIDFDGIANLVRVGRLPVGYGYEINLPFLASLIETEDSYYIDRRLQHLVIAPIEIVILYFYINGMYQDFSGPSKDAIKVFAYMSFLIWVLFASLPRIFYQTGHIEMIRKSWITNVTKEEKSLTLIGNIPKNSQLSLSTDKFVNTGSINIPFARTFQLV